MYRGYENFLPWLRKIPVTQKRRKTEAVRNLQTLQQSCGMLGQRQTQYGGQVIDLGHPTTHGGGHWRWAGILLGYLLGVPKVFRGLLLAITNP